MEADRPSLAEHRRCSASAGASSKNSRGFASKFQEFDSILCKAPVSNFLQVCLAAWEILLCWVWRIHTSKHMLYSQWVSLITIRRLQTPKLRSSPAIYSLNVLYLCTNKTKGKETLYLFDNPPPNHCRWIFLVSNIIKCIFYPGFSIEGARKDRVVLQRIFSIRLCKYLCPELYKNSFIHSCWGCTCFTDDLTPAD